MKKVQIFSFFLEFSVKNWKITQNIASFWHNFKLVHIWDSKWLDIIWKWLLTDSPSKIDGIWFILKNFVAIYLSKAMNSWLQDSPTFNTEKPPTLGKCKNLTIRHRKMIYTSKRPVSISKIRKWSQKIEKVIFSNYYGLISEFLGKIVIFLRKIMYFWSKSKGFAVESTWNCLLMLNLLILIKTYDF